MARLLRDIAREILGPEKGDKVWGGIDFIGDIAIIRKPFDLGVEDLIPLAQELLKRLKWLRSVWASVSPVEGVYRLRELIWLAGEKRTETIYREHGCLFKVDIARVYISPRLSYEHIRISRLVRPGEFIINMFAGAGLFSIVIARHAKPSKVISIDLNEYAYKLMVENARLNKVEEIVIPIHGDALEIIKSYRGRADRVLMPLPDLALKALPEAVEGIKDSGYIHAYEFVEAMSKREALEKAENIYRDSLDRVEAIMEYRVEGRRVVRSVGPRKYQVVLDIWVRRS
ncbi:MAG: class I SAM-dependent methyltransferase family protein [Sulfolobales archaeon]